MCLWRHIRNDTGENVQYARASLAVRLKMMESEAVVVHPIRSFQQNQHVGLEIFSTLCSNVAKADLPKRLRWNMQLATSQSALYHNEEHDHAHTNSISRAHLDLKPISSEKKLPTV